MSHGDYQLGADSRAKLDRAKTHLKELSRELSAFTDRHPYTFVGEPQLDGSQIVYARISAQPPLELGLYAWGVFEADRDLTAEDVGALIRQADSRKRARLKAAHRDHSPDTTRE